MRVRFVVAMLIVSAISARELRAQVKDTTTLATVVVSATKTPSERASLTQAVTVISGESLRAQGITRVSDALRSVPGAILAQNGSTGSVNTLFLRGGESRYTKVLVDGVAVNAPGGFFDFSHLTTDNIERIEIVRGPASVVYGADAMTGIVQIFTRQGRGPLSVSADARGGTQDSREVTVDASGSAGGARYSIGGGTRRTDGIFPFNNQYYNGTLSSSVGYTPVDGSDVVLSTRYSAAEYHYPTDFSGAPVDSNSYRVQHRLTVGLDASTRVARDLVARLRAGTNEVSDLTEDIYPANATDERRSVSLSRNKRRSAEFGVAAVLPFAATLNVGAEYVKEREETVSEDAPVGAPVAQVPVFDGSRDNKAVYGEFIGSLFSRASYTLAARRDDNSDYDAYNTYRIGTSVPIGATTRLRASISTAFNAPAFNQLHPTLYTLGSPNLRPEQSRAQEIALEQTVLPGILTISAGYFRQRFTDLIQYIDGGPPDFLGSFGNLAEAESNGGEVEVSAIVKREWTASVAYTYVKPEVTRVSEDYAGSLVVGDRLLRRPAHSGNLSVAWTRPQFGSLSLMTSLIGERPDMDFSQFPGVTVQLPRYARFDVAGSKELMRFSSGRASFGLTFRVDNALDTDYEDVFNFRSPGRTLLIGARYSGSL